MSLISVIIPVYNKPEEIERSIRSVLNQTHQNFEILIIDDCSEDNIEEAVKVFNDERIKYYRLERKGNANIARNLGIKKARGEYIAMLDSDDEWLPEHLERRIRKIKEENCDGVFGSVYRKNSDHIEILISRPLKKGEQMINYLFSNGSATTPSQFYKKECAEDVLWNEDLYRHQDYDFTCRFAEKYTFCNDPEVTVVIHAGNAKKLSDLQFDSCKLFSERNKNSIKPYLYAKYLTEMLSEAKLSVSKKFFSYYLQEMKNYIEFISLNNFLSALNEENKLKTIKYISKYFFWLSNRVIRKTIKNS